MKKKTLFLLASILTMSLFKVQNTFKNEIVEEPIVVEAAQHAANFDLYTYTGTYYNSITATGEGLNGSLRNALTDYILPKAWPTYSGTSSSNCLAFLLQEADENPENSSQMIYLYTRDSVNKNAASSWNREHVWPQSLSNNNWGKSKAGTDLLHIRPTYSTTNSTRGNLKFGEVSGGTQRTYNGMPYGETSNTLFEPLPSVKGDVARIIMYTWVAYKNYYSNLPAVTNVFESYNTLLTWHTEDKPDVMEGYRNDFSETSLQKNRNPFVDRPEMAWQIFGDSASPAVKQACMDAYPLGGQAGFTSYAIQNYPNQLTYTVGDTLNTTGLLVRGYRNNGTSEDITAQCVASPTALNSVGTTTITVTYQGNLVGTFDVAVNPMGPVDLISVNIPDSTVSLQASQTYQINPTFNPTDVYPVPNLSYSSSNASIASVSSSGLVTANSVGEADITVTATQNSIVKTTTLHVIVDESGIYKIRDIYEQAAGTTVKFYGLFLGAYSQQGQGIFVGDGDYAIMLYNYTNSIASLQPYETYVKVEGKVAIFNNLYEIGTNTAKPTIITVSSTIGQVHVDPVTTYRYTGDEALPDTPDYDPAIQSRPTMAIGDVKQVDYGNFGSTEDTKVELLTSQGNTLTIFIKKNAGLNYSELATALSTPGQLARLKGYLSIYKTAYQLILPTVVYENSSYTADAFALDLLNMTAAICSDGGLENNRNELINVWLTLEQDKFLTLSTAHQTTLKNASTTGSTNLAKGMARYDYVVGKYFLTDFIDRNPAPIGGLYNYSTTMSSQLVLILIFGGTILLGVALIYRKNRKNKLN
jgi:endonuclease I